MVRASVTLMILLFITFILDLAGYESLITTLIAFFSEGGLTGIIAIIATAAIPAVFIGLTFFSGSTAFSSAGVLIMLPLVTFPYGLFTTSIVPQEIKFLFAGIYVILIAMSGFAIMRGDT